MFPVSQRYLDAVRKGRFSYPKVTHRNLVTGVRTALQVVDGSVSIDVTSRTRRTLSLTVPAFQTTEPGRLPQSNWDVLDTPGGELTVSKITRYSDGTTEPVQMGVFIVVQDQIDLAPSGNISISAPDRWQRIGSNGFGPTGRASVPGNAAWQEVQRLTEAAFGASFPGWAHLDTTATTKVGVLQWDISRENAIAQLLDDNGLELFADPFGKWVLQPVPGLSSTAKPVWTVQAGTPDAVLVDANRTRDRGRIRNAIILTTSATDVLFAPVEVKNTTAGDPLNVTGPLGYVPMEYSSPGFRNSGQARTSGLAMLSRTLGVAKQLSITAFVNDALDGNDIIRAVLPRPTPDMPIPTELHILDQITTPLGVGTQDLTTRSTRPDTDGT